MFKNSMAVGALPERVYQIGKYLSKKAAGRSDLNTYFTLNEKDASGGYLGESITAARELGLINELGSNLSLAVDPMVFKTRDSFRRYCNAVVFKNSSDLFYNVSRIMVNLYETKIGRKMSRESFTSEEFATYIRNIYSFSNTAMGMRAWRFWASFLGLGIIANVNKKFLYIPNMAVNLKDAIANASIPAGEYTIAEFLRYIQPFCNEALPDDGNHYFNLAMSNGLRELHDNGVVKISYKNDTKESWRIHDVPLHSLRNEISHITIGKDVKA